MITLFLKGVFWRLLMFLNFCLPRGWIRLEIALMDLSTHITFLYIFYTTCKVLKEVWKDWYRPEDTSTRWEN